MSENDLSRSVTTSSPLQAELVRDFGQLQALAEDWNRLWRLTKGRQIFHHFGWACAWWSAYGGSYALYTPVIRMQGEVVAILPLVMQGRTLLFLGHNTSDYNNLMCVPSHGAEALAAACELLLKHSSEWDECRLHNVAEGSSLVESIGRLPGALRRRCCRGPDMLCHALDLREGKEEKLARLLGKYSTRRVLKALQARGSLEFRHLAKRATIEEHLPVFARQHIARRAMAGDRSGFLDPRWMRFYLNLLEEFDADRPIRFSVLELNGQPVAYHFGFELDGRLIYFTPTFDVDLWDRAPGAALMYHLLDYSRTSDVTELDLTWGNEAYKLRIADLARRNHRYHLFSRTAVGRLRQAMFEARELLRNLPPVYNLLKGIATRFTEMHARVQESLRTRGAVAFLARVLRVVVRRILYARTEVLLYALDASSLVRSDSGAGSVEIRQATLSDLAVASPGNPDFLTAARLTMFRKRLQRGDEVYTAYRDGDLAHVAWLRTTNRIAPTAEIQSDWHFDLPDLGFVIFDCWTAEPFRRQGIYRAVLGHLISLCLEKRRMVWIYTVEANTASRRGIESTGFKLHSRVRETTVLGRFRKVRVEAVCRSRGQ